MGFKSECERCHPGPLVSVDSTIDELSEQLRKHSLRRDVSRRRSSSVVNVPSASSLKYLNKHVNSKRVDVLSSFGTL